MEVGHPLPPCGLSSRSAAIELIPATTGMYFRSKWKHTVAPEIHLGLVLCYMHWMLLALAVDDKASLFDGQRLQRSKTKMQEQ